MMGRNIKRELLIFLGILAFLIGIAWSCHARAEGVPVVALLDPLDTTAQMLYVEKETPAHDPLLKPGQVRLSISGAPIWYVEKTGELKRIATDLRETIDVDRMELGFACETNTIKFLANQAGEAVYYLRPHFIRLWLSIQDTTGAVSHMPMRAVRPSRMTMTAKSRLSLDDVLPGLRIEHRVEPGRVKEFVTIAAAPETKDQNTIRYVWQYESNLNPVVNGAGIDWRNGDQTVFQFPAPRAWDANGAPLSAAYELGPSQIAIILDAQEMAGATYPVTIDPTVTTGQSDATANRSVGEDTIIDEWNSCYAKVALPDLTGLFSSIDSATFKAAPTATSSTVTVDTVQCDVVGAWDETSSAATLVALSFNASTDSAISGWTIDTFKNFNVLGAVGTNGIRKIYADDSSPSPCTVKMIPVGASGVNDLVQTALMLGQVDAVNFYPRTDATYYWRLEIVYTGSGAGGGSGMHGGSVGILGL